MNSNPNPGEDIDAALEEFIAEAQKASAVPSEPISRTQEHTSSRVAGTQEKGEEAFAWFTPELEKALRENGPTQRELDETVRELQSTMEKDDGTIRNALRGFLEKARSLLPKKGAKKDEIELAFTPPRAKTFFMAAFAAAACIASANPSFATRPPGPSPLEDPNKEGLPAEVIRKEFEPPMTQKALEEAEKAYEAAAEKLGEMTSNSGSSGSGAPSGGPSAAPSAPNTQKGNPYLKLLHLLLPGIILGTWIKSKKTKGKLDDILIKWMGLFPLLASAMGNVPLLKSVIDPVLQVIGKNPTWWGTELVFVSLPFFAPADLLYRLAKGEEGAKVGKGRQIMGYGLLAAGWAYLLITYYTQNKG